MNEEQLYLNFDEYRKVSEPHKRERAEAWRVAIGLQAVDGLQVSEYLKQTARQHIEFFRNLLMWENNELKNRYMLVNLPEEWIDRTVPHKYRISTGQAQDKCVTYKIDGALIGKRNRIFFTD